MALALLADGWARARGGACLALTVDHRLRPDSAAEAALTTRRLAGRGIAGRILTLHGLVPGPRLAERARDARYAALGDACRAQGVVHLLLGHHAADQAETVAMRMLRGSHADGLAGMAALVETAWLRLLRPLLALPPSRLRATLRAAGMEWVEDPSNRDPAGLRARLRQLRRDPDGSGKATAALVAASMARGRSRQAREAAAAAWLGRHAALQPHGRALLDALPPEPAILGAVVRAVAGADRPPRPGALARWLAAPRAATLGGVMLRPAGRSLPGGWVALREPAATGAPVPAAPGAVWDRRFRLLPGGLPIPEGATIAAAAGGLPCVHPWDGDAALCWWPAVPVAGGGFVPASAI